MVENEIMKRFGKNKNLSAKEAIVHNLWHIEKNVAENFSTTIDFLETIDDIVEQKNDYQQEFEIAEQELEQFTEQNEFLKTLLNQDQLA